MQLSLNQVKVKQFIDLKIYKYKNKKKNISDSQFKNIKAYLN